MADLDHHRHELQVS
jgi:hypothetical protein